MDGAGQCGFSGTSAAAAKTSMALFVIQFIYGWNQYSGRCCWQPTARICTGGHRYSNA
jgi:hypothetical protein